MEEELILLCPCCNSELTINDVGDLELVNYPVAKPGRNQGIGNLTTIEASPDWKQEAYFYGQANGGERAQPQAGRAFYCWCQAKEAT